jgi:hypothetical protein
VPDAARLPDAARPGLGRVLTAGVTLGLVGAAVLAVARQAVWFTDREAVNLGLSLAQVAAGLTLLAVALPRPRPAFNRVAQAAAGLLAAVTLARAASGAMLGFSGYVMPGHSVFSTEWLGRVAGFAGGVLLVALAGVVLAKAADGVSRRAAALILAGALLTALVWQVVAVVQFFQGRALIRLPRPAFKALAWGINHQGWQLGLLLALALLLVAVRLRTNLSLARAPITAGRQAEGDFRVLPAAAASGTPLWTNPAQWRLVKATARRRLRFGAGGLLLGAGVLLAVTVGAYYDGRQPELSPAEPLTIVGNLAIVNLDQVDDGHLHRFAYTTAEGVEVRFIVIKKNGVAYGVGLDACEICGATGYYERDGKIICRLCDVVMNVATIGFKGGCNPIPLDYVMADGSIQIDVADLAAAAHHFA